MYDAVIIEKGIFVYVPLHIENIKGHVSDHHVFAAIVVLKLFTSKSSLAKLFGTLEPTLTSTFISLLGSTLQSESLVLNRNSTWLANNVPNG